jgi:protein-L-isoaspartate(D-aspartate) O-methyltransferase
MTSATGLTPRVQAALDAVDEASYTIRPDGTRVPQSSAPRIIATMLDLLSVQSGHQVLEIGTGSGYSTALLTELVGENGHVTTVEIDPDLTARARLLLHAHGHRNVDLITGDGRHRPPGSTNRFHHIIAWTTVDRIPHDWTVQAAPGAIIVSPISLTRLAKTHAVLRARYESKTAGLVGETLIPGGFVEAHDQVLDQWLIPPRLVDALIYDDQGRPWWLSADWVQAHERQGRELLRRLIRDLNVVPGPLTPAENGSDFYAYLLAAQSDQLTTAALGDPAWHIGVTSPGGAALISAGDGQETIHAGDAETLDTLTGWAERWRALGRPGYCELKPEILWEATGWTVRATL